MKKMLSKTMMTDRLIVLNKSCILVTYMIVEIEIKKPLVVESNNIRGVQKKIEIMFRQHNFDDGLEKLRKIYSFNICKCFF